MLETLFEGRFYFAIHDKQVPRPVHSPLASVTNGCNFYSNRIPTMAARLHCPGSQAPPGSPAIKYPSMPTTHVYYASNCSVTNMSRFTYTYLQLNNDADRT